MDIAELKCKFCKPEISDASMSSLKECLPDDFPYVICGAEETAGALTGSLHVQCSTVDDVHLWVKAFHRQSHMTFRILTVRAVSQQKTLYNTVFRCMHNTLSRSEKDKPSSKNTNCPALMKIRLQKSEFEHRQKHRNTCRKRPTQSKDPHMPQYPMTVFLNLGHNHPIKASEVLKFRDVGAEAEAKITALLQSNLSPSTALEIFKNEIRTQHPDDYAVLLGDRHHCPDLQWCYRLYYKLFQKEFEIPDGEDLNLRKPGKRRRRMRNFASPIEIMPTCPPMELQDMDTDESTSNQEIPVLDPQLEQRCALLMNRFLEMARCDVASFTPALEAFCKQGEQMTTSEAILALHSFGNYHGNNSILVGLNHSGVQPATETRHTRIVSFPTDNEYLKLTVHDC